MDAKADLEARDKVTMWPVQPGAIRLLLVVVMMESMLGHQHWFSSASVLVVDYAGWF